MTAPARPSRGRSSQGRGFGLREILLLGVAGAVLLIAAAAGWLLSAQHRIATTETRPRNLAAPPGGYWIHSFDTRIHFREWGARAGRPLLLVHGVGAWSGTWEANAPALAAAGFHVIAMDLPPFGFSEPPPTGDYSLLAQARRVQAVIERLGPQPVTVVAHDGGAAAALQATVLTPQRVGSLVLVDADVRVEGMSGRACRTGGLPRALLEWPRLRTVAVGALVTDADQSAKWLREQVAQADSLTPERIAPFLKPLANDEFSEHVGQWMHQDAIECERGVGIKRSDLQALRVPVSLLWGELDARTPLAQAKDLQSLLPGARLTLLRGVGHIPQIEDVPQFNRAIAEVLRSPP